MEINYRTYQIEIFDDPTFVPNSYDNKREFKKNFFEGDTLRETKFSGTKRAIILRENGAEVSSAIICEVGGATMITPQSIITDNNKIWICICNKVYCLEIPTLELRWKKEIDFITNFSINRLENDLILHGELEIKRITLEGEIVWSFGGRDIWVNIEGKPEFTIEEDKIRLFDFESNEYVIDFNGRLLEDNPRVLQ